MTYHKDVSYLGIFRFLSLDLWSDPIQFQESLPNVGTTIISFVLLMIHQNLIQSISLVCMI